MRLAVMAALVNLAGCLGGAPAATTSSPDLARPAPPPDLAAPPAMDLAVAKEPDPEPQPEPTMGGPDNTFEHISDDRDPFAILQQRFEDGPPRIATRLHSCQKIPYATLAALLASRGVDLKAVAKQGAPPTAGQIFLASASALGAPNYAARVREPSQQTTSGATRLMDVFIAAAPEMIKAMPSLKACQVGGVPAEMFDGNGDCTPAGITCLTGATAKPQQVVLCSQMIRELPSVDIGRQLAVAAVLAAAHTCE